MTNDRIIEQATAYKKEVRDLFEKAVADLIALGYKYSSQGANFLWTSNPTLDAEANKILRGLSDQAAARAKARALKIIESLEWDRGEYAWNEVSESGEHPLLFRFDMQGSFLKELLEVWLALAFVNNLSQSYLRISVIRFINNPYASPLWRGLPAGIVSWGRGYGRNIIDQITLIGTDSIIGATRYAEWLDASARGAVYYIRRRGSNFKCDVCESLANTPIPIDVPWDFTHARCMCYPEYHYEGLKI